MTVQHGFRFVGVLIAFGLGIGAAIDWNDGYRMSGVGFGIITLYVAYLVATAEVRE